MSIDVCQVSHSEDIEWPASLDVKALLYAGWQPTPFRTFVLKLHSRCNLKCDYCYMYQMADQSWLGQPRKMSAATVDMVAARIGEHVAAHQVGAIELVLHGGEPLLAGPDLITYTVRKIRDAVAGQALINFSVQTNGVRLDRGFLAVLKSLDVAIGVSLDGDRIMHDRHRRLPNGRGSHASVVAALATLTTAPYRRIYNGLLCLIDLQNDPVATYEEMLAFSPPLVDFLLPHGNWSAPPPGRGPDGDSAPYGDWLIAVFDRWYHAAAKETGIRLFEEIINLLLGGTSQSEDIGLSPVPIVTVETNGDIEQSDMLKAAYHGAAATGLNVVHDPFDSALLQAGTAARQLGFRALAPACQSCPLGRICGGGLYPHRYRRGKGFSNPSVYCADLYRLITHIKDRLARDVTALSREVS